MRKSLISVLIVVILVVSLVDLVPQPAQAAIGLNFGGKIIYSQYFTCHLFLGIIDIPIPVQWIIILNSGGTSSTTLFFTYYQYLLQIFGVTTTFYNWAQYGTYLKTNTAIIGKYIPAYMPWVGCPNKFNLITEMASSLF